MSSNDKNPGLRIQAIVTTLMTAAVDINQGRVRRALARLVKAQRELSSLRIDVEIAEREVKRR